MNINYFVPMSEEEINDYICSVLESVQFDLLVGDINGALANVISKLTAIDETIDHPIIHEITKQSRSGHLETVQQVNDFFRKYHPKLTSRSNYTPVEPC